MAEHNEYTGEVREHHNWETNYSVMKDDGTFTRVGRYQDFFQIGEDRFVVMPYYHDGNRPWIMSAAEVMDLIAAK